ncbi:MAG: penicillin-binding protein 2 [Chloroflexi bacterium]|nr:MAG: penicillin-binding protein 2 [Chloroflexota bacterium]
MSVEVDEKPRWRLFFLSAVVIGIVLLLIGQLVRWQVVEHERFLEVAAAEHRQARILIPRRGVIVDRNGRPLAMNVVTYDVSAAPNLISDPYLVADRLWPLLGRPRDELINLFSQDVLYVPLGQDVPMTVGETIMGWGFGGITVEPSPHRFYPEGSLAAHVLGFVNAAGRGYYGVEGFYNDLVEGEEGVLHGERDPWGEIIPIGESQWQPPREGRGLVLTIDRDIQFMVEQELAAAVERYQAQGGTIIVMNPNTGAILALASYPTYNPNTFYEVEDEHLFTDPASGDHYEPGSVFKVITLAAGLDAGIITPDTPFFDSGAIEVGGQVIRNWDKRSHGNVTMSDVLILSLNTGAAHVSTSLGAERFYAYVRRFGFGLKTEVELAGEVPGSVRVPGDPEWHESDLGTNAFGQGLAVTPLQMITAVSAIANHGLLPRPYVVAQIVDQEQVITTRPYLRQAVSPETAQEMTEMMVAVVERGAKLAAVPGYRIAGKTGTSQMPIPGGYDEKSTIASFVGFGPADDPQFIVLVKIVKPTTSPWGAEVAAPVFKRIAEQLFLMMGIPPDDLRQQAMAE